MLRTFISITGEDLYYKLTREVISFETGQRQMGEDNKIVMRHPPSNRAHSSTHVHATHAMHSHTLHTT